MSMVLSRHMLRLPFLRLPRIRGPILPLTRPAPRSRFLSRSPTRLSPTTPTTPTTPANMSFSQRLKHLVTTYGYYALGVYIFIGVIDFGIAFAGINLVGAETVSYYVAQGKALVYTPHPVEPGREELDFTKDGQQTGKEGLYAMLVLAYTVHKTLFVPLRVGITAAFTPRLVRWLQARGWAGGKGTLRAAEEMRERLRRKP